MPPPPEPPGPAALWTCFRPMGPPPPPFFEPHLAEGSVRVAVRVGRSGNRYTYVSAHRCAFRGVIRAVELSTARTPSITPTSAVDIAWEVAKQRSELVSERLAWGAHRRQPRPRRPLTAKIRVKKLQGGHTVSCDCVLSTHTEKHGSRAVVIITNPPKLIASKRGVNILGYEV